MKRLLFAAALGIFLSGVLLAALALLATPCTRQATIALWKCKEYHDSAFFWKKLRGQLPERLDEMEAPLRPGEAPFIEPVQDPWGHRYVLERDGDEVRVRSLGPDGRAATQDDIVYPER